MRRKIVAIIVAALCLTGCGNTTAVSNDVSYPVSDVSKITESVFDISRSTEAVSEADKTAEAKEKSDEESVDNEKVALYDKYADICDCLEKEDYDKAIELIEAMKPELSTETIQLTLENWSTYFSKENEIRTIDKNANGEILDSVLEVELRLKPEYREKLLSISGEIGYECDRVPHIVTNIDKATGLFDTELVESGPIDEENYDSHISTTKELDYCRGVIQIDTARRGGEYGRGGANIIIYGADEVGIQYLYYPEDIRVIRVNGELILSK